MYTFHCLKAFGHTCILDFSKQLTLIRPSSQIVFSAGCSLLDIHLLNKSKISTYCMQGTNRIRCCGQVHDIVMTQEGPHQSEDTVIYVRKSNALW